MSQFEDNIYLIGCVETMNSERLYQSAHVKVEEMEEKLGSDDGYKDSVLEEIKNARDSILPMRLRFNDLINTIATIDKMQGKTPQEKFLLIRTKVIEISSEIQSFCSDYHKLQPVFEAMQQYSKEGKTSKKFSPLETLMHESDANVGAQGKPASGASPVTARQNKSNVNTPTSNVPTPSSGANAPVKKPRKPRQKKNSISGTTSGSTHATPSANPSQILSNMSPMNMMSSPMSVMSPANNNMNIQYNANPSLGGAPKSQAQNQRHIPTASQQISMNNITPANILNMSMMEQNQMQTQPLQQPQPTQPTQQGNNSLDLNNLDLNNLDLSNLNMDFLQ